VFNNILVVCMGNICRSPVAEFLLKQHVSGGDISSAGLTAMRGGDIDPMARAVALSRGLDCPLHKARQLTPEMCRDADLILVMENQQRQLVSSMSPQSRGKIFLLGRFADNMEIPDPYLCGREVFEEVHTKLVKATDGWVRQLTTVTI
jgi:protein-tyrosine phosphatase